MNTKQQKWEECRTQGSERMKELGEYFSGEKALTRVKKNEHLQNWFNDIPHIFLYFTSFISLTFKTYFKANYFFGLQWCHFGRKKDSTTYSSSRRSWAVPPGLIILFIIRSVTISNHYYRLKAVCKWSNSWLIPVNTCIKWFELWMWRKRSCIQSLWSPISPMHGTSSEPTLVSCKMVCYCLTQFSVCNY